MKKTTLALLIAAATSANVMAASDYVFNYASTKGLFKPLDLTADFADQDALKAESGSLTFHLKNGSGFSSFFGAADPNSSAKYLAFYMNVNPKGKDTIGIEIKNGTNLIHNNSIKAEVPHNPNDYRTITYTFDKTSNHINIYVDGKKVKSHTESKFFADIPTLANAFLGETHRSTVGNYSTWRFNGEIFYADFDHNVLTDEEIADKHTQLIDFRNYAFSKRDPLGSIKTDAINLFSPKQQGANNYRIPALLSTQNGTVIAAIDKRNQHSADWGNIDTAIRRSLDGGKSWEDDQVVLDLASQPYGTENSAFLIDPVMVQDKSSGRIFMMLDMFPEMKGFFGFVNHSEGTGYKNIGGKHYRLLTDEAGNHYTVRENGVVYNESNKPTDYRVVVNGNQEIAYKDLGDLYQGETRLGNIFLNSKQEGSDRAPLSAKTTGYLWITHSDDDGKTWSQPVDITPQVKADWMQFLGTGPGTGIQLKNGNLVLPVYYTNNVGGASSQSAALIISRDGGKTWERGESPTDRWEYHNDGTRELTNNRQLTESQLIELDNGDIKLFSRNNINRQVVISTSKDGGYTWQNSYLADDILAEPYSQLSVIKYSKKIGGKEVILFANPHSTPPTDTGRAARVNGKVWLGFVEDDGTINWQYNTSITAGNYAYNSLAELPNGDIGLLYEGDGGHIQYVSLNLQELVWHDNLIYRDNRDNDLARQLVSLDSPLEESFYKIGDGEMVKVGQGINQAHLVVMEGAATLNQQADSKGEKQAYQSVLVQPNGTVRLGSADQLPLASIYLNDGTLDLNGQSITLSQGNELKATADDTEQPIYGNIINENPTAAATLIYRVDGENQRIFGNLGNTKGDLNLTYQPTQASSQLAIQGNTILNVVDVQSGSLSYLADTQHQAKQLNIGEKATVTFANNTITTIAQTTLHNATDSQLYLMADNGGTTAFTTHSTGAGNIIKKGDGLLKLTGKLNHTGTTSFEGGSVEFNGELTNSHLIINNTTFGGTANIQGDATWKGDSQIMPGFNQLSEPFAAQVMQFANVINEGAAVLLRVNNRDDNMQEWQHDELLVNGKLQSEKPIPLYVELQGEHQGHSDTNNNGKYDIDEGISLVQVAGENNQLQQFSLQNILSHTRSTIFQYALVNIDKSLTDKANSHLADKNASFYDYRLQTLLINEEGGNPNPVIRSLSMVGTPLEVEENPAISDLEIANILLAEKQKELDQANAEKAKAQQAAENANTAKSSAEKAAEQANADKVKADQNAEQANVDKANADAATQKAEAMLRQLQAEQAAADLKKQQENEQLAKQYRAAVHQKVPSYLVANNAMLNHGDNIRRQFSDHFWSHDTQGFYVSQQNGHADYRSNLGFNQYGYGYKAHQSSTLFGGYTPLNAHTTLHAAVGFGKQRVTPQAVDGSSETRYKSTSFLVGLHNQWDNVIVNTTLGYHLHRGKISTAEQKNISRIEGTQTQIAADVGYQLPLGQFTFTPMVGLSYQHLRSNVEDNDRWNVSLKPYKVFSQQVGSMMSWKNDIVRLTASAFYEHNQGKGKAVDLTANGESAQFATGRQGDALRFKLNSEFNFAKHFTLGLHLEHRHALSSAKLKQTEVGGKLEYQF